MSDISTNPPIGMRDFLAKDMIKREYVVNKIKEVFERFGFDPWETPAVERLEVLQGKYGEEEKLIYKFQDLGGRWLALRYDLTVPLARVVARFPQLPKPIKRYQISRVWRYERKQKGRYKEFWQCDVDIVGSSRMIADAEIVSIVYKVLKKLGFEEFNIRINNRKILSAIVRISGVDKSKVLDAFRSIDKLDKVGIEGVRKELKARGIKDDSVEKLVEFISIKGNAERVLSEVESLVKKDEEGLKGVEELKELLSYLPDFRVKKGFYSVDLSLVRGLDYYTGPIFETVVTKPKIGSISGGGRYDNLISLFAGTRIPAVGVSFGLERIIDVMEELNMIKTPQTKTDVFVACVEESLIKNAIKICDFLRENGVNCQMDLMGRKLSKQLEYVDSKGIPYAVIIGKAEVEKGLVKLKDMKTRSEELLKLEDVPKKIKV
ncbi:MAG: histidine--tRNA ligase [Candidatus Aenigmarchaeota archaeon]|nr:histidine--tRNA ligase [Candidatus Aenigmarchaeota archaeon]